MSAIDDLIQTLQDAADTHHPDEFRVFLQYYYEDADIGDLLNHSTAQLLAAAYAHYDFARQPRQRGQVLLRHSQHDSHAAFAPNATIVEIVTDDMPFLIDSLFVNLNQHHAQLQWIVHPVITAQRDDGGHIRQWLRSKNSDTEKESLIQIAIQQLPERQAQDLADALANMLDHLHAVVSEEHDMRAQLTLIRDTIIGEGRADQAEVVAYLDWLANNHFLFMGYCEYALVLDTEQRQQLQVVSGSGLGLLTHSRHPYSSGFAALSEADKQTWLRGERLILNKSQRRANIHRNAYYDLIGIQKRNELGQVIGQWRFIGLYTARAYLSSVWDVPILRQKAEYVVNGCDFIRGSYKDKTLHFVLQTYPRDELFEIHASKLAEIASGMVALNERPRVRLFTRRDDFKRYVSAIVYLPRDQFDTDMRLRVQQFLADALHSNETDFNVQLLGDSQLARVHLVLRTQAATLPDFDNQTLEQGIHTLVRGWQSEWQQLAQTTGLDAETVADYAHAFSAGYHEHFTPAEAVADMQAAQQLAGAAGAVVLRFGAQPHNHNAPWWLNMYFPEHSPSLTKTLPIIENLGLNVYAEEPFRLQRSSGTIGLSHFSLALTEGLDSHHLATPDTQNELLALLLAVWTGSVENDRFNALVAAAGICWRESVLLRALAKYLKQAGLPFGQDYIAQCLMRHADIVRQLTALFAARLHPQEADAERAAVILATLSAALAAVPNLDEDRMLNAFLKVILAIERTNFWQPGQDTPYPPTVSFKIRSAAIDFLPKPHPLFEIWVYSPRMEGVHLRGAKVARGGLRWSDRQEDFRTEILGLVKAQMVKNAVIVPHGSKGGFVCKQLPPPSEREAYAAEGVACYRVFINALLDLTDNLVQGHIVPPEHILRRDEDDPYLVVAADKGTARFSDVANDIAQAHGFWLDDAFASGGSAGYDHKGMGITARGAWTSVQRHFRHLGKDIQHEDFTVIGIGDMAGDVFGNGMLLSPHIRLQAAFNHRHIFIDPNPDAATSHAERQRLFTAVAGWEQYDSALISAGGGVFERSLKTIPLSPEVKAWLKLDVDTLAPNALIHELLKAEVELLYNGGIGTYIKASTETHAQVQDRANDDVRVDGRALRAHVLGEGGNLGATQLGRIEFWQQGARCATDAIDNSAGVDCSDHEVNIKILLGSEIQHGRLNLAERNTLLHAMTDEVAQLVLRNNYLQTQILAMNQLNPHAFLPAHVALMRYLKTHASLSRSLEFLPNDAHLKERDAQQQGLTNPEVAVLLAYSKIHLQSQLLDSDVPDDGHFLPVLIHYFPHALRERFQEAMHSHYLKREIIANQLANRVINRMGISFVQRFSTEMNVSAADVVRAYWVASEVFDGEAWFAKLEALDNRIAADTQMQLMSQVARLLNRVARLLLHSKLPFGDIGAWVAHYHPAVNQFMNALPQWLPRSEHTHVAAEEDRLAALAVLDEHDIALLARLPFAENTLPILDLADTLQRRPEDVAQAYFSLSTTLQMSWLYRAIAALPRQNEWQNQACLAVREDVQQLHLLATQKWLQSDADTQRRDALHLALTAAEEQVRTMQGFEQTDLAMLSALSRNLLRLFA